MLSCLRFRLVGETPRGRVSPGYPETLFALSSEKLLASSKHWTRRHSILHLFFRRGGLFRQTSLRDRCLPRRSSPVYFQRFGNYLPLTPRNRSEIESESSLSRAPFRFTLIFPLVFPRFVNFTERTHRNVIMGNTKRARRAWSQVVVTNADLLTRSLPDFDLQRPRE